MQIWMQGVFCNLMNDTVRNTVDLSDFDPTNYGVDEETNIPLDDIQTSNVIVSSCPYQLSEEEITTLTILSGKNLCFTEFSTKTH